LAFTLQKPQTGSPFGHPLSSHRVSNYFRVSLSTILVNVDPKDPIQRLYCGSKNMKPSITYTPFRDLNDEDFVLVRLHDPNLVSILDGKSTRWCCERWRKCIFQNGEGSMVGPCEKGHKYEWTKSIWGLLEWKMEM